MDWERIPGIFWLGIRNLSLSFSPILKKKNLEAEQTDHTRKSSNLGRFHSGNGPVGILSGVRGGAIAGVYG